MLSIKLRGRRFCLVLFFIVKHIILGPSEFPRYPEEQL